MCESFDLVLVGKDYEPVLGAPICSVRGWGVAFHMAMEAAKGMACRGEAGAVLVVDADGCGCYAVAEGRTATMYDAESELELLPVLVGR